MSEFLFPLSRGAGVHPSVCGGIRTHAYSEIVPRGHRPRSVWDSPHPHLVRSMSSGHKIPGPREGHPCRFTTLCSAPALCAGVLPSTADTQPLCRALSFVPIHRRVRSDGTTSVPSTGCNDPAPGMTYSHTRHIAMVSVRKGENLALFGRIRIQSLNTDDIEKL